MPKSPGLTLPARSTRPAMPVNGESRSHRRAEPRPSYNRRGLRALALGMVLGMGLGAGVMAVEKNKHANSIQPSCDVPVRPGEGIENVENRVNNAGDNVYSENTRVIDMNGKDRTSKFLNGQRPVQVADHLRFSHVDPNVCFKVGGEVVNA